MIDYAIDVPDERDYEYEAIFGADEGLPSICIIDDLDYQDQSLEQITKYMCVFYSSAQGSNIQNHFEWSKVRVWGKELWLIAIDEGLLDIKAWAYIQSWPKLLRDEGYIDGWAKVNTIDTIRSSIYNQRPIVVWSNKVNWSDARVDPFIATLGDSYWHAFIIIWYDDIARQLICKNSYWDEKYDGWLFYISYDNYNEILYPSKYSLLDSKDPILEYKAKIMEWINIEKAKEAFELWLWNGKNATQTASREEVATMILRGLEKLRDGGI